MVNYKGIGVPKDSERYFILDITNDNISLYDTFDNQYSKNLKASITIEKWKLIKSYIIDNFKKFSKDYKYRYYTLKKGENLINVLLGKELAILLWGIEATNNNNEIERAVLNWRGFEREERWYLYTMTNANLSKDFNRGWRGALKKILIEN